MRKVVLLIVAAAALALSGGSARQALADSLIVNTVSDHTPDGSCDANECTLREAIAAVQDSQTIAFNIAGDGPHVIQLNSAMDGLFKSGVTIDGYTQPGAAANTAAAWQPENADIRVVLDGSAIPGGQDSWGLWLSAKNLTVRGLSFVNFEDEAIKFATFPSAAIKGNYIGLYPDGHTVGANSVGITLRSSEVGNLVGGTSPADRNVISGNTGAGIAVTGSSAVVIAGNFIGTDAAGAVARPNGGNGIDMKGGAGSTIGGSVAGSGNLVSGNTGNGIAISTSDGRSMNVKGNRIGVAGDGQSALGNGLNGVFLDQDAYDITIGGEFEPNEQNIIAYNGHAGVSLSASASDQNYIDPNQTFANGGLGADLLNDEQVLANDHGDADNGPNNRMNYPVITGARLSGTSLAIDGQLDTIPNQYSNMFFFANSQCDPSGYGEGEKFLGSYGINPGASGVGQFHRAFNNVALGGRGFITMSASDPESSSEFSACVAVDIAPDYNCDNQINQADVGALVSQLATGDRGAAPSSCSGIGVALGDSVFGDPDCDGQLTPRDPLVLLIALAGADQLQLPAGCADLLPS
jgi:CSLREA domain-containing protein